MNQIGHCFCLSEVHTTVHEGAHGVFSWICQSGSSFKQAFHNAADDVWGAVAADFKAFLASEALSFFEVGDKHFVNVFAVDAVIAEKRTVGF